MVTNLQIWIIKNQTLVIARLAINTIEQKDNFLFSGVAISFLKYKKLFKLGTRKLFVKTIHFLNEAFQSHYDILQLNRLVQN